MEGQFGPIIGLPYERKEAFTMNKQFSVRKLALLGMLAALVFAGNYARIVMPLSIGSQTSFTLANIFCCLSGLIMGPIGGLASGIGSLLYDLTDPRFVADCWITFITKGAMGFAAGLVVKGALKQNKLTYGRALAGTAVGCIAYYILYFAKTFFYTGLLKQGLPAPGAWLLVIEKIPASVFNAAVALIAAPPLVLAVIAALKRSKLDRMLRE